MASSIDIIIQAVDKASSVVKGIQGSVGGLTSAIERNRQGMESIRNASAIALTGVVALGTGALMQASKMQDLRQSFDTLTGSAEKGKALFMDIQKFASQTPFDSAQLAQATSTMLGFGVSQEKVLGSMKMLGDIAMGNGERLGSLSLAFGQVQAAGKLTGQDLLQMINAGFNPLEAIAKRTGETMAEVKERMSDGAVSVKEVEQAMKDVTSEGGRFFGGMEKASKTFSGVMSTLRDNIGITLASLAGFSNGEMVKGGLLDNLTQAMTAVMPYLESFAQWASQNGTIITVVLGIVGALAGLVTVATTIGLLLPSIVAGFSTLGAILGVMTGPIGLVVAGIAALGVAWSTNFLSIRDITVGVWESIKGVFQSGIDWILTTFAPFFDAVKAFWTNNGTEITAGLNMFWEGVKVLSAQAMDFLQTYFGVALEGIKLVFGSSFDLIIFGFKNFFTVLSGILTASMQILNGDFSGAWQTMKTTVYTVGENIIEAGRSVFERFHGVVTGIVQRVQDFVSGSLQRIKDTISEIVTLGNADTSTYNGANMSVAGARAVGGYVSGNTPYLVGERGPELFVPTGSGRVVPNGNLQNSTPNISINISGVNINNGMDMDSFASRLQSEIARSIQLSRLGIA